MTTYKQLFGKYVQNLSSDPTSTDAEGQIWYNSTSGTFKTALGSYGVWVSGGNMNNGRGSSGFVGTQTAALMFGGTPPVTGATESYNGTSWTSVNSMNTARSQLGGAGTQTAALGFAGYAYDYKRATEEYTGGSPSGNIVKTLTVS